MGKVHEDMWQAMNAPKSHEVTPGMVSSMLTADGLMGSIPDSSVFIKSGRSVMSFNLLSSPAKCGVRNDNYIMCSVQKLSQGGKWRDLRLVLTEVRQDVLRQTLERSCAPSLAQP